MSDKFLKNEFERQSANDPVWKTYNGRKFLCYEQIVKDDEGEVKMHYFITGEKTSLIICSFAYSNDLLEDEYSSDEVEDALDEVDALLESMVIR